VTVSSLPSTTAAPSAAPVNTPSTLKQSSEATPLLASPVHTHTNNMQSRSTESVHHLLEEDALAVSYSDDGEEIEVYQQQSFSTEDRDHQHSDAKKGKASHAKHARFADEVEVSVGDDDLVANGAFLPPYNLGDKPTPCCHPGWLQRHRDSLIVLSCVCAFIIVGAFLLLGIASLETSSVKLQDMVSAENIMVHLQKLQDIAMDSPNQSRSVLNGYNASAQYVIDQLTATHFYDVTQQYFQVPVYTELARPFLRKVSPDPIDFVLDVDYAGLRYGGNGVYDFTAPVTLADNEGCDMSDFSNATAGSIALVALATSGSKCELTDQALNAQKAGAKAVLVYSKVLTGRRARYYQWTPETLIQIPTLTVTSTVAQVLMDGVAPTATVQINTEILIVPTFNVIAKAKKGDPSSILMVGGHLDSVPAGPGLNDNGSGSQTVLELALRFAAQKRKYHSQLAFAFWGAEELGLLGSYAFVNDLKARNQLQTIKAYLNFDMAASPNYIVQVFDGASADNDLAVHGSTILQMQFQSVLNHSSIPYALKPMTGGSDYYPFSLNGVPSNGLAAGAGEVKTAEDRSLFGGLANAPLDPCYHQACDTIDNINQECLQYISQTAATVVEKLASTKNLTAFLS